MKRIVQTIIALLLTIGPLMAEELELQDYTTDSLQSENRIGLLRRIIRGFDKVDERYIEPQHYVFTVMLQSTYTYEFFDINGKGSNSQSFSLAPDGSAKVGPYFGWRWIFGGYAFNLTQSSFSKKKTEFNLSIYSSQIGVDLFYRRTGSDYKLRDVKLGKNINTSPLEGVSFDGVRAGVTGVNLYYIFNHGRFSYPAAFAQSTCQKISCGSWMAGIGYTHNTLEFDHEKMQALANERLAPQVVKLDSALMFKSILYNDFSISGGYGYNWVFAKNWVAAASAQLALGYKRNVGSMRDGAENFTFSKISPNMIGRFGVIYNNMRWYAGMNTIIYMNTYRKSDFSTTNMFGNMYLYMGYNFGLKKKYREKKNQ